MKPAANYSRFALLSLAAGLLISCLAGVPQTASTPTPESGTASPIAIEENLPSFGEEVEEIVVAPILDSADAVTVLVPEEGGEVHLVLVNGLAFTLTIPPGALVGDLAMTMTPIRSLGGIPLSGGMIAGVELEPDGTRLLKPATLKIEVPGGFDRLAMVGFGYHAGGQGFHLDRARGDGQTIEIELFTFSGHGAGSGTADDISRQIQRGAANMGDDFNQRTSTSDEDMERATEQSRQDLTQFYKALQPLMKAASTNDKLIDQAQGFYYEWRYEAELMGLLGEFAKENEQLYNLLVKGLLNAFRQASNRCVANQDISESGNMVLRIAELNRWGDFSLDLEKAWPDFEKCLRFKLILTSDLTWKIQEEMEIHTTVSGTATLFSQPPAAPAMRVKGQGQIQLTGYTISFTGAADELNTKCNITTPAKPGTLFAYGRLSGLNLTSNDPYIRTIIGINYRGMSQKLDQWKCDTGGGEVDIQVPAEIPTWTAGFILLHKDEYGTLEEGEYHIFGNFKYQDNNLVGAYSKRYTGDQNGDRVEEDFSINIFAAPGAQ